MCTNRTELRGTCEENEIEIDSDASDTLLFTPSSSSPFLCNIEYGVKLPEVQEQKFYFSDDSCEEELHKDIEQSNNFFNGVFNYGFDNASLGDVSEQNSTTPTSSSDIDPGLPRNDFLDFEKCRSCQTDKKSVNYPYCLVCFKQKKNTNQRKHIKQKKRFKIIEKFFEFPNLTSPLPGIESNTSENTVLRKENSCGHSNNDIGNVGTFHSENVAGAYLRPSTAVSCSTFNNSHLKYPEGCRVCFSKPESGLFVHAKTAHLYGCYSCAQEIWYQNGACPICRSKVFKVIKLYT